MPISCLVEKALRQGGLVYLLAAVACWSGLTPLQAADEVSFREHVAPLLVKRCLGCHENRKSEGRYALHTFAQLLKPGDSGQPPIVAGKPEESYFFQKLIDPDTSVRMPQEDDALAAKEIELVRQWIAQGAKFDGGASGDRLVLLLPPRQHPEPPAHYHRSVPVFALRFSPDGRWLYSGGVHEVLVWDVTSGVLAKRISGLPQRIHALRFSPDGQTLAVAGGAPGEYGEIRLLNVADRSVRTLPAWEDVILDVAFSHDGSMLVAGGADNSVRGYEVATGKEVWRNQQHVDWVTAIDVTDGAFAEEQVANETLSPGFELSEHETKGGAHPQQVWIFPSGRVIIRKANWELELNGDEVVALTRITITGIGKTYNEKRERLPEQDVSDHQEIVAALMTLARTWGRTAGATPWVVTASRDRTAKVFALNSGALFTTYKGHRREYGPLAGMHRLLGVQAEPGTRRVWSGGEGAHFHGWNPLTVRDEDGTAADMEERFAKEYSIDLIRHDIPGGILAMIRSDTELYAVTPQGKAESYSISGPTAKFDLRQPAHHETYTGPGDALFALDCHATTRMVAAGGFSGEIAIWSLKTSQPQLQFRAAP